MAKPNPLKKAIRKFPIYFSLRSLFISKSKKKQEAIIDDLEKKNVARQFVKFRKENILVSEKLYCSLSELQHNPPQADCYIVGSDQVWAHLLDREENTAFYLNFGHEDIIRISYAPSFSYDEYPLHLRNQLAQQLKKFNAISVREKKGVEICKNVGFDAALVVDPTILLESSSYDKITEIVETTHPYIFIYSINIKDANQIKWEQLKEFAKQNNYDIYATPATGYFPGLELFDNVEYKYATIPQWLAYVRHAELVITTSFHGVVFSILYHKKFVYFPLEGVFGRGNNRVLSLLKLLDLENFTWRPGSIFEDYYKYSVDWARVDTLLFECRKKSAEYLYQNLKSIVR